MLLKELIKSRGVKQKWLATKIGVSEVTISHWVTEKAEPTKENVEKLCKILNISDHDFTN